MKTYFLGLVISILVTLNITSCGCNNSPKDKRKKIPIITELTMEVNPQVLNGQNERDIEVTLMLTENSEAADLSKYKLKGTFSKVRVYDSNKPTIMYTDANGRMHNKSVSFEENISDLVLIKKLEPGKEPIKVKFSLRNVEPVISLEIKFELLEANDKVLNEEIIYWKCQPSDLKLEIDFISDWIDNTVVEPERQIGFKIEQVMPPPLTPRPPTIDPSKLRLIIRQLTGTSAKVFYEGKEVTELAASDLGNLGKNIVLVIEPDQLKETKFVLELVYADMGIVATGEFKWRPPLYPGEELSYALRSKDMKKINQLLQSPDINIIANSADPQDNKTPLCDALYERHRRPIIDVLLQASSSEFINHPDEEGNTPLHYAVLRCHKILSSTDLQQIIQSLLDKKANLNAKNNFGIVPLYYAVSSESLPIIQKFLDVPGIDLNVQSNENLSSENAGNTPLHLAIRKKNPRIVDMLLKKGAREDIKNTAGKTAVDLAQESSNKEIKKLFGLSS